MKQKRLKLKKELGLFETTVYGVGVILGAGIYAIIGEGAGIAGNAVWLSFIIAAIIASFTGLSYAELSSMHPKTAAEYNYTKRAFKREYLSFIVGWIMIIAGIIAASAVSLAFAGYFSSLFSTPIIPVAMILIALLSLINFIGIKQSSRFNIISTIIEASGLIIIIIIGLNFIGAHDINYFAAPNGLPGMLAAVALIFFAFIGFEDIANISEETKNAPKIIPKALILSLIISTVLYILVSISAVSVIGFESLAMSKAPLTDVAVSAMGPGMSIVLSVIALFATGNTALIMLIVVSRMMYGISRTKSLPFFLSKIHNKRRTPYFSILITMILGIIIVNIGDLGTVASLANLGIFIAYFFVNLSLIWLRFKEPNTKRPFKMPINIGKFPVLALLGIVTCFFMFFYFEPFILLAEIIAIISGYIIYSFMKLLKKQA